MAATLSNQAIATRDLAKRARRLAGTVTTPDDADRLRRYADEREAQAADLERRAKESHKRRDGCGTGRTTCRAGLSSRWP
jgi:hypothetical protein